MRELIKRAEAQHVINTTDYKRITNKMSSGEIDGLAVTIIDSVNGTAVASIFDRSESLLDRGELQGGISPQDYGKMSLDDKKGVAVRGIRIDDTLESVDVFPPEEIARAYFEKLTEVQKEEAMKTKKIVDKISHEPLTRDLLHDIAIDIARRTEQKKESGGGVLNTSEGEGDGTD